MTRLLGEFFFGEPVGFQILTGTCVAWFDLADIFLNINCGSSVDIQDPDTRLTWYADDMKFLK